MRRIDMAGMVYGRLIVQHADGPDWLCLCTCGRTCTVSRKLLITGRTQSCGCLRKEVTASLNKTHGASRSALYDVWCGMKQRCEYPKHKHYHRYGGRGIKVCLRWQMYATFAFDMGYPLPGQTLERIDNDGDYTPTNCRWATRKEQGLNRADNKYLTVGTETLTQSQWAGRLGISSASLKERLDKGWSVERACTEPKRNTTR